MSLITRGFVLLVGSLALCCKPSHQCEVGISRVISHGATPTYRALAEFNDSGVLFMGNKVVVAPSNEGYLIIANKDLIKKEGNDLLEFVSKRIQK